MAIDYSTEQGDAYHKERHAEIFGNEALISSWGRYSAHRYLSGVGPNESLLEVGAGTGINIAHFSRTHSVSAVEPADFAREHCDSLGISTFKSLGDVAAEGREFDWVLLRHVLEHVPAPAQMLSEISSVLAPGGTLIVVVPLENPLRKVDANDIDHHLYCWNPQSLANLADHCGMDVKSISVNWYNGRRILRPLLEVFGVSVYAKAMAGLGRLRLKGEIVCELAART